MKGRVISLRTFCAWNCLSMQGLNITQAIISTILTILKQYFHRWGRDMECSCEHKLRTSYLHRDRLICKTVPYQAELQRGLTLLEWKWLHIFEFYLRYNIYAFRWINDINESKSSFHHPGYILSSKSRVLWPKEKKRARWRPTPLQWNLLSIQCSAVITRSIFPQIFTKDTL